jgi:hypothetical protein
MTLNKKKNVEYRTAEVGKPYEVRNSLFDIRRCSFFSGQQSEPPASP